VAAWEPLVAAAFVPFVVWVLWRVQAIAVDQVLRRGLYRLLRNLKPVYNVVSWTGVLLHETSHAVMLLLGGHGIRGFKVGIDAGHVTPSQVRKGPVGLLTFVAAALAPLYIAPGVILLLLVLLVAPGLIGYASAGPGLDSAVDVLRTMFVAFPPALLRSMFGLDLATWTGAAVFLLAVFALPAARPSHVKGRDGAKDEGDIAVARSRLRKHPLVVAAFFLAVYGLYFALVPLLPVVYWAVFQTVWAVAMTGILLAVVGGVGWWLVARTGRITPLLQAAPWLLALAAQVIPRMVGMPWSDSPLRMNAASAVLFAASTLVLATVAGRRGVRGL